MSLTLIEIDGQLYHAQQFLDEDGENVIDTIPILDEIEQKSDPVAAVKSGDKLAELLSKFIKD